LVTGFGKRQIVMNIRINLILGFIVLSLFSVSCRFADYLKPNTNSSTNSSQTESSPKNSSDKKETANISPNCQSSYYPVGPEVERKYHIKYQKGPIPDQDYTERYTDFNNDSFVGKNEFKEVNTTINWRCTSDGLLSTQYGNSIDMKSGSGAVIETLKSDGVSFPNDAKWIQGGKWTTNYEIKETIKNPNGQQIGEGNGKVTQNSEVIGEEQITVPAGNFQTLKIRNKTTLDLTVKVSGMSVPTKTLVETTAWFAKDVGMVKSESRLGGIATATTELVSYKK
jgi:hypothetical protein